MKTHPRSFAIAAVLLLLPGTAPADPLSLEDAVRATMLHGPELAQAENRRREAEGTLREAQGAFDWTAAAQVGWERLYVLSSSGSYLTSNLQSLDALDASIGASRTFRDGISISPGFQFYSLAGSGGSQILAATRPLPTLGIKIPLLRGLGEEVADAAEVAAEEALSGTNFQNEFALQRAVHDTVQAYWRCVSAGDHVAILDASEQQAAADVDRQRQLTSKGLAEPSELQKQEADLALRRVNLGKARDEVPICLRDLALLMGTADPGSRSTVDRLPLGDGVVPQELGLPEDALVDTAIANRKDLHALERIAKSKVTNLRGQKDTLRPELDIYLDPRSAGLRFSRSLENDAAEGRVDKATAEESQAWINVEQLQTKIRNEVLDAAHSLHRSRADFMSLTAAAASLEAAVTAEERRAGSNEAARPGLIEARQQLATVRHGLVDLELEYAANLAALRLDLGTLDAGDVARAGTLAGAFRTPPSK
jgi:outer membrane protein TolC